MTVDGVYLFFLSRFFPPFQLIRNTNARTWRRTDATLAAYWTRTFFFLTPSARVVRARESAAAAAVMHLCGGGGGGRTNVHDDCTTTTALYTRRIRGCIDGGGRDQTGFFAVVTHTYTAAAAGHGWYDRVVPPKPRRVVKAPARHHGRRRRGISRATHGTRAYASSHLHLRTRRAVLQSCIYSFALYGQRKSIPARRYRQLRFFKFVSTTLVRSRLSPPFPKRS